MTVAEARALTPPDVQAQLADMAAAAELTADQLDLIVRLFGRRTP